MPPLSCLPVSLYPDFASGKIDIDDWTAAADFFGLDAVDLSVLITRKTKTRPAFPVDTIVTYTDFTHPNERARKDEMARFRKDVRDCAAIGAKYLRVTAGQAHPQIASEQGLKWAELYLKSAAKIAEHHKIKLLFENHSKPGVWQYYDFAGEPEIYFELIGRLENTGIDLLFDTANACFYKQDPVKMLEKIFARVRRIHVSDITADETLTPVLIGEGTVPLTEVIQFLKANDFTGALSIEEASFTGMAGIERAVCATRELWNNA